MKRRIFYAKNKTIVYGFRTAIASFSHLLFAYGPFLRNEASLSSRAAPALLAPPPSRSMNVGMHYLPFYTSVCCRTRSIGASCPQPPDLIGPSVAPIPCRHAVNNRKGCKWSLPYRSSCRVAELHACPSHESLAAFGRIDVGFVTRRGRGERSRPMTAKGRRTLWALNSGGQWRAHAHEESTMDLR